MQSPNYDYGLVALPDQSSNEDEEQPLFWKLDSSLIEPGIYRNKLIITNGNMYFTSKNVAGNHVPFNIEVDPFQLYNNYSLNDIMGLVFFQDASMMMGYNWMDNICIKLIERMPSCEVATYKFNGNRADNSGNGYHLSQIENGPVMFVEDRFGNGSNAISLNVNNQEIFTMPGAPNINDDFTLSAWVKPLDYTTGTDTAVIFSNYSDISEETSMMIGIFEQTGQVFYGHLNTGGNLMISLSDFVIPAGVWSHLVLKRESAANMYTLYWNGEEVNTYNYPAAPNSPSSVFVFSVSDNNPNFSYKGALDGLRLWDCVMDDAVVDSLYHAGGWPQVMCDDMAITINTTNAACNFVNGTATVSVTGGSGDYTITWSNGDMGTYADTLSAGMHSVQVMDNLYGCMMNQFFYINNTGAPTVDLTAGNLLCYQSETGYVNSSITGGVSPYTLEWSNGSSNANITALSAGTYMLTVVDGAGCVVTESIELIQPEEMQATFDVTNSSCGNNDGEITVNVSGGTGAYTYTWSNGAPDNATISNIPAANYTVVVEDENACTASFTTGFSDSGSPIAMVDSTVSATCGELGSLYISVTGGSGSYTYEWNNGEDTEDLEEFDPGEYWLTVTDGTCMTMLHADIPYEYPQTQEICVVTVDQTTTTNLVVWEKEVSTSISHYNIYREGFVAGDYQLVGTVPYDDMSEYSDPVASPFNRSWKYKVYQSYSINDAAENNNNMADYGESILLDLAIKNVGTGVSNNANVTISTTNSHTTINDNTEAYETVAIDEIKNINNAFGVSFADNIPDQTSVLFNTNITDDNDTYQNTFSILVNAPSLEVEYISLDDATGNDNGVMDEGETVTISVKAKNIGHAATLAGTITASENSSYLSLTNTEANIDVLTQTNGEFTAQFTGTVSSSVPDGESVDFTFTYTAGNYSADLSTSLPIGISLEDWETETFDTYDWDNSGTYPWVIVSDVVFDGDYASKSGDITNSQESVLSINLEVTQADSVSFYKKVSCEDSQYSDNGYWWDYLKFDIDGSTKGQWDGEINWTREAYWVTAGSRTLTWTYYKDNYADGGSDAAWIDNIILPPHQVTSTTIFSPIVEETEFTVYPIPAKDFLNLEYALTETEDVIINITDISGKLVKNIVSNKQNKGHYYSHINIEALNKGVYFVSFVTKNNTSIKKLIIE
jgi:hypothetical protein